jgi:hypothetical protein
MLIIQQKHVFLFALILLHLEHILIIQHEYANKFAMRLYFITHKIQSENVLHIVLEDIFLIIKHQLVFPDAQEKPL